jgi:hypothetical protein
MTFSYQYKQIKSITKIPTTRSQARRFVALREMAKQKTTPMGGHCFEADSQNGTGLKS